VIRLLEEKFNSSTELPSKGEYANDPRAHVLNAYKPFTNNCTTLVCGILNAAGSCVLETNLIRSSREVLFYPALLQAVLKKRLL
jgi:hypothetical protein